MNSKKWTNEQRSCAWIAISYARRELSLTISPCIASAFVLLHKYFADPNHKDEPLYILLTSALFLSCKIEDTYRSMEKLFSVLSKCISAICKRFTLEHAKQIFGDRDFTVTELSTDEKKHITICEIHLLNSIDWNMDIDLPFNHFNDAKPAFSCFSSNENLEQPFNYVLRDLCLIMKDEKYLEIPPPVSAAVSIQHCFSERPLPESTSNWINQLRSQYPKEFEVALHIIEEEGRKCVPIPKSS
ncbi:hypothetical protein M9Y10_004982 [Tritrichomonas musculus]|uniref:Cyclin N-terminal domain-containing protein n=1 Tax=Tritrichomonas musculus TaxID=1915356 RepID=A0ABR2JK01_9EUKA